MRQSCKSCGKHTEQYLDLEKSISFSEIPCGSNICSKEKFVKCIEEGDDVLCGYELKYEENSKVISQNSFYCIHFVHK